jgi:hypothetical protein
MSAKKTGGTEETITIVEISKTSATFHVVGTSPILLNSMNAKVIRDLLFPAPKKNAVEKATTLKHDPREEFGRSPYRLPDPNGPTLLALRAASFKGALMSAALDMPGAKKAQIGRLAYVESEYVPLWGVPQLYIAVVRQADINRTPDPRTFAIVPKWASEVTITFVTPNLKHQAVANLLAAAGIMAGVGDGRPQKGKLNFGQFRIAAVDDPELLAIKNDGGSAVQAEAMKDPSCYDVSTQELLEWFDAEVKRREFKVRSGGVR